MHLLRGHPFQPLLGGQANPAFGVMRNADVSPDDVERMRQAYERDVAVLPPDAVAGLIASGGFETPVPFLQTGLIHAWYARWPGACT